MHLRVVCLIDWHLEVFFYFRTPFYVCPVKPTHGLKSFSWTCCGLVLSFGPTTLNLVPCGFGFSDASAGVVISDVAISFWCWFCIIAQLVLHSPNAVAKRKRSGIEMCRGYLLDTYAAQ